jgi:hypothetical protein
MLLVPLIGPFSISVPDETFQDSALKKLYGEQWSLTKDDWPQQG